MIQFVKVIGTTITVSALVMGAVLLVLVVIA